MASDSQDSRLKHRRSSSDDEWPEDSKRHKHPRHHRRRHHHDHLHRHRHNNKKHDEEKDELQVERKIVPSAGDYDIEEGEIIEDEVIVVAADTEIADKKLESDVESGEFKAHEGRSEFDDSYTRGVTDMVSPGTSQTLPAADNDLKSTRSDGSKKHGSHYHYDKSPLLESVVNGDYDNRFSKLESMSRTRCKSPSKECSENVQRETESKQQCLDLTEMGEDEYAERRNSSSHKVSEDRHKASSRSPSQSILYDEHPRMRHRHERDERLYDNGKVHDELDGERGNSRSRDHRFGSRDIAEGRRDYRSRMCESKDERGDYSDREREEKRYKDKKRDNDCDRVLEKERNRSRGRDLDWDTKQDRERRRDKDHGRSRDRDLDREQKRDNSIGAYRDRHTERERDNRLSDRDRRLEMDNGRDRNSSRDRHRDKIRDAESDRSRRYHKYDDYEYGNRDRRHGYDEAEYRRDRGRKCNSGKNRGLKDDSPKENADGLNRDDDDQKDYQERVGLELAEHELDDTDRIKEESRKLREAILKKYKAQQPHHEAMLQSAKASKEEVGKQSPKDVVMTVAAQQTLEIKSNGQDSSAVETSFDLGKSPLRNDATTVEKSSGAVGLGEGTPKCERSNDMFHDDIFGDSPAGVCKTSKGDGLPVERSGLHDNWDDPEGYYSFRFGEILDSRYEITAAHGKGVFSTVVRAKDLKAGAGDPEEVAIKIIRNNETMLKAGTEELVILKKLVGADQDDRRHCVRYLSHFKYRNHLCIVFESLNMNLREVLKKFGRNIGLKLTAVRAYAKQLFIALKHLRNCGVLHCDIKPDNMLVNDAKNVLKLCDFGSGMFAGRNEITPYLVSRFYRAPEIILGLPYDHPVDMWSVGCCLYELYIGKVLFPGLTNNDMLRLHMELKGPFPKKMLRKGAFVEQYFDPSMNFLAIEEDPVTKKPIRRPIINIKPKDISTIIKGSPGEDLKMLANFKDLLDKIFALDPEKRLTVSQALNHSFITGK